MTQAKSAPNQDHSPDHVVADQSEVAAWLADPRAHGAGTGEVERITTHGAMVFLAGDRAYKIKRAVRYPYMDFSSLALRQAACEREVALNRRTAPELYLAAEPITRTSDGSLQIGGTGEVVEWLVVMRRFDQSGLFDRLAQAGSLTPGIMTALADEVAKLHEVAEPVSGAEASGGGAAGLRAVIQENATELSERPDLFPEAGALEAASLRALKRVALLLDRRLASGLVRRCHGDLHLRNICRLEDRPVIFDCIEFNDAISCIDVLYDLAFLLMDLEHRGLRRLANVVFNRYMQRREDLAGLAALPLFLVTRAAVRAKVSVSMAAGLSDPGAVARLYEEAKAYEAAARAYLAPEPPRLIAVGGLSGTGKTSLARDLAPGLGAPPGALHLRSDVLRKRLAGVEETTRLPPESYSAAASETVYDALLERAQLALMAGHAVVVDAVCARPAERAALAALAEQTRVSFTGLWLEAPEEMLIARVAARQGDASDATAQVVRTQQAYDLGEITWARLDAAHAPADLTAEARRLIARSQASSG